MDNLTAKEKENLFWFFDKVIEDRQYTTADIYKNFSKHSKDTTWISIHDVKTIIIFLSSNSEELQKFRDKIEPIWGDYPNERIFKGLLTEFFK